MLVVSVKPLQKRRGHNIHSHKTHFLQVQSCKKLNTNFLQKSVIFLPDQTKAKILKKICKLIFYIFKLKAEVCTEFLHICIKYLQKGLSHS
jgi:hypothetical protein